MALKVAHSSFEKFQKARLDFATEVLDLADKPFYVDALQQEGVLIQLKPLLSDTIPSIAQTAAAAVGKLAGYTPEIAGDVVSIGILPKIVEGLKSDNIHFRKAGAGVLRSVAKHTPELAKCVVESGAPEMLTVLLEDFNAGVREASAGAISAICSQGEDEAHSLVDAGCVPLLVVCLQEPDVALKRACASALAEIAGHSVELATVVSGTGTVPHLVACLKHSDAKLKRQAANSLAQVCKHNVDLAEVAVEAGMFPAVLGCLQDNDTYVRRNAAIAIREVVKHSEELAAIVNKAGGAAALVEYANGANGGARLAAVMALGYIGSYSESLSSAVLSAGGCVCLKTVLQVEPEDHLKAAAVWALGQLGKHDSDHANILAQQDVLRLLQDTLLHEESSDDLRTKAKRALKAIGGQCTLLAAMQSLLPTAPLPVLTVYLAQFEKIIPTDAAQRRDLVASGGLKIIQTIDKTQDAGIAQLIDNINSNYPAEVVEYCAPGFSDSLADRL